MLSIADRHVFSEWLKIFVLVIGSLFGLLIIFEIQNTFSDLLEYGASAGVVANYFLVIAPSFLTVVMPASILVSILYALGQLNRGNEIVAFRATGMSVFRVTRSIWAASAALSLCLWYLNSSLIPWSVERAETIMRSLQLNKEAQSTEAERVGIVESVAFDNRSEHRLWFINRYSQFLGQAYGITVSIMDAQRRETRRILARNGYFDETDGHWILFDGRDLRISFDEDDDSTQPPFERLEVPELTDDPELMILFRRKPADLSFLQLKRIVDNFSREDNPKVLAYQARLHALMASAASCLVVAGIAIPFALSGVRANPFWGVVKSIGMFFGFYLLTSVLNAMGRQGVLPPAFAAWVPMALMIVVAYVFVRRVR